MHCPVRLAALIAWVVLAFAASGRASLADSIVAIQAVGPEGQGNPEAGRAWKELVRADATALPELFRAMDGANDLAANWLRAAVEVIVDRTMMQGGQLPFDALQEILRDTSRNPRARRMAYELIVRVRPEAAEAIIPRMADDPSIEMRYDAVQRLIARGDRFAAEAKAAEATAVYRQALESARELTQIRHIKQGLDKLGVKVDLPRHFGFLMQWQLIGPFDNSGRKGFDAVFAPEVAIDMASECSGKSGAVRWAPFVTDHEYGIVNINLAYGPLKEVTAYAYAEFTSDAARPAELRLGCKNAWKLWANGRLLFGRDEYHRGMEIDQYRMPLDLKAGKNTILVKVCQNEQTETWTKEWEFQLRVCDARGTAILSADRPPGPIDEAQPR